MENPVTEPIRHSFVCLPYLNLKEVPEIDLGFAKVWNFSLLQQKYIPDQNLREHVVSIMDNYRDSYPYTDKDGKHQYPPIQNIGFISTDRPSHLPHDEEAREKINDARLILFISSLAWNNTVTMNSNSGHSMVSSENFSPLYFSAVVNDPYMSEHTGFAVPFWHGGIEISKNLIIKPKYVPRSFRFSFNGELLHSLIRLRSKNRRAFRRIISAVEVFLESYYNSPEVSHNARILLQSSAFEILIDKKDEAARKEMKSFIELNANYKEDRKYSYKSEQGKRRVKETGTKKVMWADRFFTLRNHIAHGLLPKTKEYYFGTWQRHFDIATYFFVFFLKRKIEECLKKEIFGDDIEWKKWEDDLVIPKKTYEGFVYETMGRRSWERMMRRFLKKNKK